MTFEPTRPLAELRKTRSSIKWRRYEAEVLPMFVAEMDFDLAPAIVETVAHALRRSDTGYLDRPGPLATAFARFADLSWGWQVDESRVHLATDVTVGVIEALRLALPPVSGRVVLTPPVYAPFFGIVAEAHATVIEVPLREADNWALDAVGIEKAFASGADAFLLCNPHNPTGRCHSRESLENLARLAARYDVFVVSDEVHAPLAHPGSTFTPFATVAEPLGARSATVTSASKGWNLAGLKCALIVAGDPDTARLLRRLPEEVAARTSILGLHANIAAYAGLEWRDAAMARIVSNYELFAEQLAHHAPDVHPVEPDAGYLVWLDFRETGLGDDPAEALIAQGRIALNSGPTFGASGRGFARINLACDPSTVVEAVHRIALAVRSTADHTVFSQAG